MILYHGTSVVAWNEIRQYGVLADINSQTELDFGHGFYASTKEDYAYVKGHARKVTRDSMGIWRNKSNSVIIKFKIDEGLFENVREFIYKDDEFIDFVFDTRYNYISEHLEYDVIIGPMADGTVDSLMGYYRKFRRPIVKRFVKWCYRLPFNRHRQIVIKTQRLCDEIRIMQVKNLKGEVLYEQKTEDQ